MAQVNAPVYSLNGGEVGKEALARLDLERLQFAGSLYSNILPRVVGSMTFRPGLEHIADIDIGDVMLMEYSYSGGAELIPILSNGEMRVIKDGAFVSRATVATSITNGDFSSFTGWTDDSTGTATAGVSGGNLELQGTTQDTAIARQTLTVSTAAPDDRNTEHGLRILVTRGPVNVKLGTTSGGSDLINALALSDGDHSIAFTPGTGTIYLELSSVVSRLVIVESCEIDAAGTMVLETPWATADIDDVKYKQHKDVVYCASGVYQQRKILRRGDTSWGIQRCKADDGPFVVSDRTVAMAPSVFTGNGTLTASRPYFDSGMVGRLFRLVQSGQAVYENFSAAPSEGASIRVSGVGAARDFTYTTSGTWSGTVRVQVATDNGSGSPGAWSDLVTLTTNTAITYRDPDNNVVKFFRFVATAYTSGTIQTALNYNGGSQSGIARVTAYTSTTVVDIEVVRRFYSLGSTFEWDYSVWSDYDGWPSAVDTFGGRLYWGQKDFIYGSVPDSYESFDDTVEGDSAPISRSIGSNTQRGILWLMGLQRLMAGTDFAAVSIKSSSFDEPLTAASWFPLESSTRGCFNLRALKCDKDGIFVQTTGKAVFTLVTEEGTLDYGARDLTAMHEMICDGFNIVDLAVQRRPDTVIWFVLSNGEVRALTYEPDEKVIAWSRIVTDGLIKRVAANRGSTQDSVYFAVERGGTQRLERLANMEDCKGGSLNCLADGFTRFSVAAPQDTFSVPHLDGLDVTVWVNGVAVHDQDDLYTVASGNVVLEDEVASGDVVIGLPYVGRWQSTKLAYGAQGGTALFQHKKVSDLGLYLLDTAVDKVRMGKDFDTLRQFTVTSKGRPLTPGEVVSEFDADMNSISSDWDTDSRICIEARAPYPFTAGALAMKVKTNA